MKQDKDKHAYAGIVNFEGADFDAFVNCDRHVCIKSKSQTFKSIGHISDFTNKIRDMFGHVNLWKVYANNFNGK